MELDIITAFLNVTVLAALLGTTLAYLEAFWFKK